MYTFSFSTFFSLNVIDAFQSSLHSIIRRSYHFSDNILIKSSIELIFTLSIIFSSFLASSSSIAISLSKSLTISGLVITLLSSSFFSHSKFDFNGSSIFMLFKIYLNYFIIKT